MSASTAPRSSEPPFQPGNRKYIGSKRLLSRWIADRICQEPGPSGSGFPRRFLDGFCGTGAVGLELARRGAAQVTGVDNLRSNCVILRGFAHAARTEGKTARLLSMIGMLNGLPPVSGYISESFGGTYFTVENCGRMDGAREEIARMAGAAEISQAEHDYLLAGFLLAADRVANTLGQYDAFLKNIDGQSMVKGRHLVDDRVRTPFRLRPLEPVDGACMDAVEGDMLALASGISVDAAYYDPPYNGRQYCDNYHVLENLARWEKPPLFGKTRKFDRSGLRSPFCRRNGAADALGRLIASTRAPRVWLSYSSEGILTREEIEGILARFGRTRVHELPYPVFGNGAGVSVRRDVTEMLYCLDRAPGGEP